MADQSAVPEHRLPLWVTLLVWVSVLALVFSFWNPVTLVFLLLLAAAAVAALLRPLSRWVSPKPLVGGLVVGLGFWALFAGLLILLGSLLYTPVAEQLARLPETQESINDNLRQWAARIGVDRPVTLQGLVAGAAQWLSGDESGDILAQIVDRLEVTIIALVVLVFGSTFLLIEPPGLVTGPIARILPDDYGKTVRAVFADIDFRLRWWLLGTFVSMSVVGVLAGVGFWLAGLDFWLPLAILAGMAEIVPVLGPTFVFLIVLLFAATQGPTEAISVVAIWGVVQVLEPYMLTPMIMRKAVRMPPVVTLFTIVLWARVFGIMGLLLAIPINIAIWACISNFVLKRREAKRQHPPPEKEKKNQPQINADERG